MSLSQTASPYSGLQALCHPAPASSLPHLLHPPLLPFAPCFSNTEQAHSCQAHSHLRAFALAVLVLLESPSTDIYTTSSLTSFLSLLKFPFSKCLPAALYLKLQPPHLVHPPDFLYVAQFPL